ncbi:MAG: tRNA pseudouridine(38-40) synthase TruA [Chloroflexi bacterium]|nr:tRNA pseudouridine(38-40) synthase TruA [Chloroflexota bacterium]
MARYQAILTYDGTEYSGMQRQAQARTVQGVVEEALKKIGWVGDSIIAAGRTDAGVHAAGQVISFDLEWGHPEADLLNALNASLPVDAAVSSVMLARKDFHPRYDAVSRRYCYSIFCQPRRQPLRERYAWRIWPQLDVIMMRSAAKRLLGEHDYSAYGAPPKKDGPTVRKVLNASWRQNDDRFEFEIEANAFLYHMVRRIVSQQIEIGLGKQNPETVAEYLDGNLPEKVQGLAPPNGLFLMEVHYPFDSDR